MNDSPCIQQLQRQAQIDPTGVNDAIEKLAKCRPLIRSDRSDLAAKIMTLSLGTMLARIFPHIHLDVHDKELEEQVRQEIEDANPKAQVLKAEGATVTIRVGRTAPDAYFLDAAGWRLNVASPGQDQFVLDSREGPNPASALLAAVLVTARVVNEIAGFVEARPARDTTKLNLWGPGTKEDGPKVPEILSLDVHAFGHGSISSALWGGLKQWPALKGSMVVIDPDAYQDHNPARYAYLPASAVEQSKVDDLSAQLARHPSLAVHAVPQRIQEWRRASNDRPTLAIISPDNKVARAWASDAHPHLAISASASDREAQVALCNPDGGICSYCLYAPSPAPQASHRKAIIQFTGLNMDDVIRLTKEWNGRESDPLDERCVRTIERARKRSTGDFQHWIGCKLIDFLKVHRAELYSSAVVSSTGPDRIHLPLPVTSAASGALALAGFLRILVSGFDPKHVDFNHMCLDVWSGELRFIAETPPEALTCLCQHPARRNWRGPTEAS